MYAITGHTDGIGKHLYQHLSPNAIGFSRSNGYDITNRNDRLKILHESSHCNVLINNAYAGFGQSELLMDTFYKWGSTDKTIINVGSRIAEQSLPSRLDSGLLTYQMHKVSLKHLCKDLNAYGCNLNIKYVWFGYVGTEKILAKYPNMSDDMYIGVNEAADKILEQIDEFYTIK